MYDSSINRKKCKVYDSSIKWKQCDVGTILAFMMVVVESQVVVMKVDAIDRL